MWTTPLTELYETFDQRVDVFKLQQEVEGRRGSFAQRLLVASIRRRALDLATRLHHFAIGCVFSDLSPTPNCLNEKQPLYVITVSQVYNACPPTGHNKIQKLPTCTCTCTVSTLVCIMFKHGILTCNFITADLVFLNLCLAT